MQLQPLTNFKIQKYYQNKLKFNGVYSRNNLPKIKDGVCLIKLDEYKSIPTHWIASYGSAENVTYFENKSFNRFWNTKELSKRTQFQWCLFKKYLFKIKDGAYVINLDE